jgi:predicted esterase
LLYQPAPLLDNGRVLLYLHGAGGFGSGIEGLFEHPDLPSLLRDGLALNFAVLIPSCPTSGHWQATAIASFLDDFELAHGREGLTYDLLGFSRGGTGAIELTAAFPQRIRTLATLAARAPARLVASGGTFPVLLVHGRSDDKVGLENAATLYGAFTATGHPCERILTDSGHYLIDAQLLERVFAWQRQW